MTRLRALWRNLAERDRVEQELDAEMQATLDLLVDEKIAAGIDPAEARRRSRIELGHIEPVKERVRDVRMGIWIETLVHDLKYAIRYTRRSPGFALSAILTLAIGIGANAAMVSVLNALVFKRLPVPEPDRLFSMSSIDDRGRERYIPYAAVDHFAAAGPFASVCGYNGGGVSTAEVNGTPAMTMYAFVSGRCFETFGVAPLLGRGISDADAPWATPGNKVAVISHGFWQRMFNGDPNVLGKTIRIEAIQLSVIGVTPEGFGGLHVDSAIDLFVPPDTIFPAARERRPVASELIVRLRDGVSIEDARARMSSLWPGIRAATIPDTSRTVEGAGIFGTAVKLESIATGISTLRDLYSTPFQMMAAFTALLVVLMCINVGGLLVTRLTARSNELAMRLALGGSRYRIAQQMVIEGLVLSIAGTALAVPLAYTLAAPISALMPPTRIARTIALTPDTTVLAFMAAIGMLSGIVITALPVWLAIRRQTTTPLAWERTVAPSTGWWARGLLISQVALSVVILIGAGLLVRSLYLIQRADIGVDAENVLDVDLFSLPGGYRGINAAAYYPAMLERIAALPGVHAVGMSQAFPRQRFGPSTPITFVGEATEGVTSMGDTVSPGFFAAVGVPFLAGRDFTWADSGGPASRVCIVTESLARALRPDGDVLQRRIRYGTVRDRQDMTIVGIVGNINMGNRRVQSPPIAFVPPLLTGANFNAPNLLIKSTRTMSSTAEAVRAILAENGREYAREFVTLDALFERAPSSERLSATLAAVMGALAVLLAVIGIHGVLAYSVSRRTREIGIRVAVGAHPGRVARAVIKEACMLTVAGVALGVPIAFLASGALRSLLYGVSENDLTIYASASVVLLLVGVGAGTIPAQRAAAVDPVIALRSQ